MQLRVSGKNLGYWLGAIAWCSETQRRHNPKKEVPLQQIEDHKMFVQNRTLCLVLLSFHSSAFGHRTLSDVVR